MFPLHVLVVDENDQTLERIANALTQAGYRVSTRKNTLGAQADILALRPDLVLLDPSARGLRGDDLTLLLGLHPETADTAVVFHCETPPVDAKRAGALGVIQKSSDVAAFLRSFHAMVQTYTQGGLPKEDRAVIAERMFSGTHRVAPAVPELQDALIKTRTAAKR
ncbi:MAG TPA: response regulator [Polyangiaceae bacterium]